MLTQGVLAYKHCLHYIGCYMESDVRPFWRFLGDWLLEHHWTQTQLGDAVGVHQTVVSKWLHQNPRRRARPGRQVMPRLAEVLNISLDDLSRMVLADHFAGAREQQEATPGDPDEHELMERAEQFRTALRSVPRKFWAAVTEASIRMAQAMPSDTTPVTGSMNGRVTTQDQLGNTDEGPPFGPLLKCKPGRLLAVGAL